MSRTTLLLIATLFASVAVHSVYSAAADVFTLTNSSFYKEKGSAQLVPAGDVSLASTVFGRRLIAGKNAKTNYYVYQTNAPTNKDEPEEGGVTTLVFRKVDVNKLAFVEGADAVTVTGFKWGGAYTSFTVGASVKNNVTLLSELYQDPAAEKPVTNIYAYLIDLDKNEKTELLIASGSNYTENTDRTTVSLEAAYTSGGLTVFLYSTKVVKDTSNKLTYTLATLKDGKLGATTTVKDISWTGNSQPESYKDFDGTGESAYVVFGTSTTADQVTLNTETVYPYTVSEKEIKAGTTAPININLATTNDYDFESIHAHPDGRWVAFYSNTTGDDTKVDHWVAKSSNDSATFKEVATFTRALGSTRSVSAGGYFGGLVLFIADGTDSAGQTNYDAYTYSYQTIGGDLNVLGAKTQYATISGKYLNQQSQSPTPQRIGDTKAYNVLTTQTSYNSTAAAGSQYTKEGVYFGQLFQKSFGATLQSVLAVCSMMLAALFFF